MLSATDLRCDHKRNPLWIGSAHPLLSWTLQSGDDASSQSAAQIQVSADGADWAQDLLWDSGCVEGSFNSMVYEGRIPESNALAYWRVRVWDQSGQAGTWSNAAVWRQGIAQDDWRAGWIGYDEGREAYDPSVPYYCADDFMKGENHPFLPRPALLRREFQADAGVASAVLYVSAFGLTEIWINGRKATAGSMVPGYCDYRKRVYGFAYEVADLLQSGENALAAVLADGWYAGYIGLNPRQWWGAKPRLSAELHIEYADGRRQTVVTDESWRACVGPWLYADIMHGTGYDATLEPVGWQACGYNAAAWHPVEIGSEYGHIPQAHPGVPIVEHARYVPAWIRRIRDDEALADFGRCFSGVVRIQVRGPRGARVDLFHAEELERDREELYHFGNRSARAHDCYILSGDGTEVFQPDFTYHGFRYVHVYGLKNVELLSIEGVAISSALLSPTAIETGNGVVNDVLQMIRNTEQSNLYEVPTDVCARDERLGWGAEGHFFMHTAAALHDQSLFLRKWLQDALDGQREDGGMWPIAPAVMMRDIAPFSGDLQSDIALHCAWLLMRVYGDMQPVREAFPALVRYFEYSLSNSDRLLRFATARDWLDLGHEGRSDLDHGYGTCDPTLLGTAWFARSAQMMAEIAQALDEGARAASYKDMYDRIRAAFRTFFLGRNMRLRGATQGGYLLAVVTGLLEGEELEVARAQVLEDMAKSSGITWGTATTPVALDGLCALGLEREAAAFIRSQAFPSLGYMHTQGATAVWERWDGIVDGRFHPHVMNAFDHIGLATVGAWIVRRLAGIAPAENGFARAWIQPVIDPEIGFVRAEYQSVRGPVSVYWKCETGEIRLEISLPVGMTGRLVLPYPENEIRNVCGKEGIAGTRCADGVTSMDLACGRYEFRIIKNQLKEVFP